MRLIQPRIARHCLEDAAWREPPEQVALFLWTEAGGLVVDNFIARMDMESSEPGDCPSAASKLARLLLIS